MTRLATMFAFILTLMTAAVASAQDYKIRRGDTLRIEVIEDSSLNRAVLVSPDGRISVPLAGSIKAAGLTVEQVQAQLSAALAPQFASAPSVFVGIQSLAEARPSGGSRTPAAAATVDVYLMGEFMTPGKAAVSPGTTVLQLFAQAKGFSRFAATKRIQLRRIGPDGTEKIYNLNYDAIIAGKSSNGQVQVQDGDVFVAPQRRMFE
ncbi:polysaccharide biosynthesis/export family protein [Frigidibacter sp. ROC022]|uniref:polysaccharide biosynthesis/export family protein n=1 Tax=Frigidibacter sp. ROC022 TaxID=2971796 RepID=UPI00215B42EC|nr:polysaccharide biosynthesis/export family protein [Frigidibacter sp. ROC022]MCR8726771.1 polysaccharide export protein [Frigidibacter sp. ROC022]